MDAWNKNRIALLVQLCLVFIFGFIVVFSGGCFPFGNGEGYGMSQPNGNNSQNPTSTSTTTTASNAQSNPLSAGDYYWEDPSHNCGSQNGPNYRGKIEVSTAGLFYYEGDSCDPVSQALGTADVVYSDALGVIAYESGLYLKDSLTQSRYALYWCKGSDDFTGLEVELRIDQVRTDANSYVTMIVNGESSQFSATSSSSSSDTTFVGSGLTLSISNEANSNYEYDANGVVGTPSGRVSLGMKCR